MPPFWPKALAESAGFWRVEVLEPCQENHIYKDGVNKTTINAVTSTFTGCYIHLKQKKNLSSLNNSMTVAMQRKRRSNAAFSVPGAMAATNIFLFDCWQEWHALTQIPGSLS